MSHTQRLVQLFRFCFFCTLACLLHDVSEARPRHKQEAPLMDPSLFLIPGMEELVPDRQKYNNLNERVAPLVGSAECKPDDTDHKNNVCPQWTYMTYDPNRDPQMLVQTSCCPLCDRCLSSGNRLVHESVGQCKNLTTWREVKVKRVSKYQKVNIGCYCDMTQRSAHS